MTNARQAAPAQRRHSMLWIMAATLTAIIASIASWGTVGRLAVATMFAIAVVALAHQWGKQGRRVWTVGAAVAFFVLSWLHIVLTSPSAAWVVDSHMVPWFPMPGGTARIIIAWSCTLGWTALVVMAALQISDLRTRPAASIALGLTGVLPLFNPNGFPVDGYELLWNRSTFAHPTYTIALLALLASTGLLYPRRSTTDDQHRSPTGAHRQQTQRRPARPR